jgi:hypothetical protein
MYFKITDTETGKEKEYDVPDWLIILVLSSAATAALLLI